MSKKGAPAETVNRIRELSKKGYSANYIQKQLQKEHRGIRRTQLLAYVRQFKLREPKGEAWKYTPKKHRKTAVSYILRPRRVAIYGKVNGFSRRIEAYGRGRELYQLIKVAITHPPKKRFLTKPASDFSYIDLDLGEEWDDKPTIKS
jgi:hypothetical protein